MKKIIVVFALLLSLSAIAQNFPGKKIELLTGKTLKVLPKDPTLQKYGYRDFYKDSDFNKVYKKDGTSTAYSALEGKEFSVLSFEPGRQGTYKLIIENSETGKLYFDYDSKYSFKFPFEVIGGLEYPDGFFCEEIYEKEMKVKSEERWYSAPTQDGVAVTKAKVELTTMIFLDINSPVMVEFDPKIKRRGIVLTFDNGETISLPDNSLISSKSPGGNNTVLTASFFLDKKQIKLATEHIIKSVKLDKFERQVEGGFTIREFIKCMLKDVDNK